jgi:hypothetical protein
MPAAPKPNSHCDRTGAPIHPGCSRSAAPTPPAASPLPARSRARSAAANGQALRRPPRSSAIPPRLHGHGLVAPAPRSACSRRSLRSVPPRLRLPPPRWAFAGRCRPATPTTAVAAPHAAPAGAPSAVRAGETPVASDSLNVRPAASAINISGLNRAPSSSAVPAPGRAPPRACTPANRSAVRDFSALDRIPRSSPAGRSIGRKKCFVVITLGACLTASGSGGFRLLTRSR